MGQVKLLSMTLVLTVLIWASADSLVNETVSVNVTILAVPAPGTGGMIVEPVTSNLVAELQVTGPRSVIADVRAKPSLQLHFPIGDRPTGGARVPLDRNVVKQALAARWSEFRELTVVSVVPDSLEIKVDHWVTRDVDVVLDRLSLAYEVEPQIPPAPVTVRLRESRLAQMPAGERLQLSIGQVVEGALREKPAGRSVTTSVTLDSRAFGPDATLTPAVISVTATVQAERATAEIPTVPILFAVSSANLERRFRPVTRTGVPLDVVTQTIKVTGPTDAVARLRRGETRAKGIIHLKHDDIEQLDVAKLMTPEYYLPPGIELAQEPVPIEFKLIFVADGETDR